MFYPGFHRLSFTYLQFTPQVRFNILSQVFWEWISGARVALSGNVQPIALLSPRTVSTRRGPRERKFVTRKAFWSPLQALKGWPRGTNRASETTRLKKGIFCLLFTSRLSSSGRLALCYSFYYRLAHTRHVLYFQWLQCNLEITKEKGTGKICSLWLTRFSYIYIEVPLYQCLIIKSNIKFISAGMWSMGTGIKNIKKF